MRASTCELRPHKQRLISRFEMLGDSLVTQRHSVPLRYGVAVACAALTGALEAAMHVTGSGMTSLFLAAVTLSTWFGGIGPGLLTTILSSVLIAVFFIEPAGSIHVELEDALRIGLFVVTAILIGWLHHLTRQSQERLVEANRAKERFLAMLSHELRNPLNPVLSLASAQEEDPSLPSTVRSDAAMIRRNIEVEVRLIDDLLDANRLHAGKAQLEFQPVDFTRVVEDVVAMCRNDIEARGIRLDVACEAKDACVQGDPVRLRQILWNLLRNAAKFTPAGGRISVECGRTDARTLMLRITDTGIGIPPDALPRIFAPFEQSDQPGVRRAGGLGLGLAIARMLVEAHHGTIQAESEGEGRGATFTVTLPRIDGVPVPLAEPLHSPAAASSGKAVPLHILLVEDQDDSARILQRLMQRDGHTVEIAGSIKDAQTCMNSQAFDLLISDLGMPDGSGLDLMRQVHQQQPELRAISLSGYGTEQDIATSHTAGFAMHLTKPVTMARLRGAIAAVVNAGRATPLIG